MPAHFLNDIGRYGLPQFFYNEEYDFVQWGWRHLGITWCFINHFDKRYTFCRFNDNGKAYSYPADKNEWEMFEFAKKQIKDKLGDQNA